MRIEDVFVGQQLVVANNHVYGSATIYTVTEIDLAGSNVRVSWWVQGCLIDHPSWFALRLFKLGPMQLGEP